MSELLGPDDVLEVLRAAREGLEAGQIGPGDSLLNVLMAEADVFGVDPETAGRALDPIGKGANWQKLLGRDMKTDPPLRNLVRATLQPQTPRRGRK